MVDLHIPVKGEYFDAIKSGHKLHEYRIVKPHWSKRLEGKSYDRIVLTRGYPKAGDSARTLYRKWLGYHELRNFVHPHFGTEPQHVFAIDVSSPALTDPNNEQ